MRDRRQAGEPNGKVIGERLRALRLRAGLTQMQLAARAGYSERLIRKAEAGEAIRPDTLDMLVEALNSPDAPVTAGQLRGDPLAVVHNYWTLRGIHGYRFARHCGHLLTDDFVLNDHGDPTVVPGSGTYHGQEGLIALYEQVGQHFKPLGASSCRFFNSGDHVSAMVHGRAQPLRDVEGRPLPAETPPLDTWYLYEWTIRDGLISRHDIYIDSLAWHRALTPTNVSGTAIEGQANGGTMTR